MNKILSIKQANELSSRFRKQNKTIVLAGGVFDILHLGHIRFLKKAKKEGHLLFLFLESDKSVKKLKGKNRPFNTQKERSEVLAALEPVDFVINLKGILQNQDYDRIVKQIQPNVLATTKSDSYIFHKERQAKLVGAKVKIVIKRIRSKSTTKLTEALEAEL